MLRQKVATTLCSFVLGLIPGVVSANSQQIDISAVEQHTQCIEQFGADKVAIYEQHIRDAQQLFQASYLIELEVLQCSSNYLWKDMGGGPIITETILDENARHASFKITVDGHFLRDMPEILFEHSARHEVSHIINDDLQGYRRNGANVELAEERSVLDLVGEGRYREYITAYAKHVKRPFGMAVDQFIDKIKKIEVVPAPNEIDPADERAAEFFRNNNDGMEHLLVYNGEIHDVSANYTRGTVGVDHKKLQTIIDEGENLVFFHNHPPDGNKAMFPSHFDYGFAFSRIFEIYSQMPDIDVEFRVMYNGEQTTSVSYGFKKNVLDQIRELAPHNRNTEARPDGTKTLSASNANEELSKIKVSKMLMRYHLTNESFNDYLRHACPVDLTRKNPEVCNTSPQYFVWPSDKFFLKYRGSIPAPISP